MRARRRVVTHAALMVPFATAAAYAGVAVVVLLARRQQRMMCALIVVVASMECTCTPLRRQRTCAAALVLASIVAEALTKSAVGIARCCVR